MPTKPGKVRIYSQKHLLVSQCASISLAAYPQHGETQNELITRADAALYKAKHGGRDRAILASV